MYTSQAARRQRAVVEIPGNHAGTYLTNVDENLNNDATATVVICDLEDGNEDVNPNVSSFQPVSDVVNIKPC